MRLPTQLLRKNKAAYKNQFGHVLVLAGSKQMLGASVLTAFAALRSGAGLVTVAVPESLNSILQKKLHPAVMTLPLAENNGQFCSSSVNQVLKVIDNFSVIALGPGLGRGSKVDAFVAGIVQKSSLPLVIDADAINSLAQKPEILFKTNANIVLTPHPGEMARLMKVSSRYIAENRKSIVKTCADQFNCCIVLKGNQSIVYHPNKRMFINKTGNAGMATAGSGDVLTGMVAAFLAQGVPVYDAVKFAVYAHGLAGDLAIKDKTKISLIATDIIDMIPQMFKILKGA